MPTRCARDVGRYNSLLYHEAMRVPFLQPNITEEDIQEAVRVLRSGWLVLSQETKKFETDFATYLGVREAVLTNSCTCSIHLALTIAGIGPGDEVITTPLTYASTVSPIMHVGAKHVFVDVEPDTGCIDVDLVRKAITKRTKAIIPVHLYGQMCDMKTLIALARKHKLAIIEDAAHAIEAKRDGIQPGQKSFAACFSFHTAKNLTAGQGGALVTGSKKVANRARLLRRDGVANRGIERRTEALGFKYLATDFQAAMLRNELARIIQSWSRRKKLYKTYVRSFLKAGIACNQVVRGSTHAYHMIVIHVDPKKRMSMIKALGDAGIQASIHYDPLHLEPYYRSNFGYRKNDFPVAERLGLSTITLPMYPQMTNEQQEYVIRVVKKVCG